MFPLNVVLVGSSEVMQVDVRRELDKLTAAVEADYPEINSALTGLSGLPHEQRLAIVHVPSPETLRQLERLTEAFPGMPLVALVEDGRDTDNVLQAMRAGASQVVPLPLDPLDFEAALRRVAQQFGRASTDATIIAVSGVSEGCGATTVAFNLAADIAQQHKQPTILVELAPHLGRVASSFLETEARFNIADLLGDIDRLDLESVRRALTRVGDNLQVLVGPHDSIVPTTPAPEHVARLLQLVRQLARVVIIDMPYNFDAIYFETLAVAHRLVFVTDQKVPSLHALRLLLEALAKREAGGTVQVVINRYDSHLKEFSVKHVEQLLSLAHVMTIANDYPSLVTAANEGQGLAVAAPNCRPLRDIGKLAHVLLGPPVRPPAGKGAASILKGLLHSFSGN